MILCLKYTFTLKCNIWLSIIDTTIFLFMTVLFSMYLSACIVWIYYGRWSLTSILLIEFSFRNWTKAIHCTYSMLYNEWDELKDRRNHVWGWQQFRSIDNRILWIHYHYSIDLIAIIVIIAATLRGTKTSGRNNVFIQ